MAFNKYSLNKNTQELVEISRDFLKDSGICIEESKKAGRLVEGLENQRLTLSIIGQFKRGKSTLINTMLGRDFLPVGIIPITSVVTEIKEGESKVFVHFENGAIKEMDHAKLEEYINEQENPNNIKEVAKVVVQTTGNFLEKGIDLVDTPGVGSIHKNNTKVAYDFVRESDGAVFMLSVDSPINEIEIDFLKEAKAYPGSFYFVVNKIDMVDEKDLEIYIDYCKKLLASIMETDIDSINIFKVSGKTGEGVKELENFVLNDLDSRRTDIMEISAAKRMASIITRGIMKMHMYWIATRMSGGNFDYRFKKLREAIDEIRLQYFNVLDRTIENKYSVSDITTNLNIFKKSLIEAVKDSFEIDYYYEIEGVLVSSKDKVATKEEVNTFRKKAEEMCRDLDATLNTLLLYREDNSIIVARRLRDLKVIRSELSSIKEVLLNVEKNKQKLS